MITCSSGEHSSISFTANRWRQQTVVIERRRFFFQVPFSNHRRVIVGMFHFMRQVLVGWRDPPTEIQHAVGLRVLPRDDAGATRRTEYRGRWKTHHVVLGNKSPALFFYRTSLNRRASGTNFRAITAACTSKRARGNSNSVERLIGVKLVINVRGDRFVDLTFDSLEQATLLRSTE